MPSETERSVGDKPRLDIEALKKLHARIDQDRRNAQAHLSAAQGQLDELRAAARRDYGTDELPELRKRLEEIRAENERKRAEYQAHLEEIQGKLADVEKNFGAGSAGGKAS